MAKVILPDDYYDTSWYDPYLELPEDTKNLVVRRTIPASSNSDAMDALTIYQPMTYDNGVIVLNIPIEIFIDNMSSLITDPNSSLIILDSNSDILEKHNSRKSRKIPGCQKLGVGNVQAEHRGFSGQ